MVVDVRRMDPSEWADARAVCIDAFDEPGIPDLLDALHSSWGWEDDLAFVAVRDGEIAGFVLFTPCFVDAPDRVVPVLVLSPVGVRPDLQGQGIGDALIRGALAELERTRPEPAVFLEGIPSYYPRFGHEPRYQATLRQASRAESDDGDFFVGLGIALPTQVHRHRALVGRASLSRHHANAACGLLLPARREQQYERQGPRLPARHFSSSTQKARPTTTRRASS